MESNEGIIAFIHSIYAQAMNNAGLNYWEIVKVQKQFDNLLLLKMEEVKKEIDSL